MSCHTTFQNLCTGAEADREPSLSRWTSSHISKIECKSLRNRSSVWVYWVSLCAGGICLGALEHVLDASRRNVSPLWRRGGRDHLSEQHLAQTRWQNDDFFFRVPLNIFHRKVHSFSMHVALTFDESGCATQSKLFNLIHSWLSEGKLAAVHIPQTNEILKSKSTIRLMACWISCWQQLLC